jgi:hypothetical protein
MAEQLSNRPKAIRQKITEYEDIIVQNGAGCEEIWSVFGQAKDRAFQAITDHSTTPTADFYQEVFNELCLRCRTSIQAQKWNVPGPCSSADSRTASRRKR